MIWIRDLGDVPLSRPLEADGAEGDITYYFRQNAAKGIRPVSVGGDHSILIGILRALAGPDSARGEPIGLVHFDADTDYYPMPGSDHLIHGAAFHHLHQLSPIPRRKE